MNKKLMLLIGLVMSLTAGSAVATMEEVTKWDEVELDNDENGSSPFGSKDSSHNSDGESSSTVKQAGFLKRAQKRVRNFVYPQSAKQYRNTQYLGHVACGTNWALILGGLASACALQKAVKNATTQITEENKKANITMSSFQVRKAAFARAWKNFRTTKLINQKALLGSGALLATGICAKLFLMSRMREPNHDQVIEMDRYSASSNLFRYDLYSTDQ